MEQVYGMEHTQGNGQVYGLARVNGIGHMEGMAHCVKHGARCKAHGEGWAPARPDSPQLYG